MSEAKKTWTGKKKIRKSRLIPFDRIELGTTLVLVVGVFAAFHAGDLHEIVQPEAFAPGAQADLPTRQVQDFLEQLENQTYDARLRFKVWYAPPRIVDDILLLTIDDVAVGRYGRWPWPRTHWANIVDALVDLGASIIYFDVLFADAAPDVISRDSKGRSIEEFIDVKLRESRQQLDPAGVVAEDLISSLEALPGNLVEDSVRRSFVFARQSVQGHLGGVLEKISETVTNADTTFAEALRQADARGCPTISTAVFLESGTHLDSRLRNVLDQALLESLASNRDSLESVPAYSRLSAAEKETARIEFGIEIKIARVLARLFDAEAGEIASRETLDAKVVRAHHPTLREIVYQWAVRKVLETESTVLPAHGVPIDSGDLDKLEREILQSLGVQKDSNIAALYRPILMRELGRRLLLQRGAWTFDGSDALAMEEHDGVTTFIPQLLGACDGIGSIHVHYDADGSVRRLPLFLRHAGRAFPHSALVAAAMRLGIEPEHDLSLDGRGWLSIRGEGARPQVVVPLDKRGRVVIPWTGTWSPDKLPMLSVGAVLNYAHRLQRQTEELLKFPEVRAWYASLRQRVAGARIVDAETPLTLDELQGGLPSEGPKRLPRDWVFQARSEYEDIRRRKLISLSEGRSLRTIIGGLTRQLVKIEPKYEPLSLDLNRREQEIHDADLAIAALENTLTEELKKIPEILDLHTAWQERDEREGSVDPDTPLTLGEFVNKEDSGDLKRYPRDWVADARLAYLEARERTLYRLRGKLPLKTISPGPSPRPLPADAERESDATDGDAPESVTLGKVERAGDAPTGAVNPWGTTNPVELRRIRNKLDLAREQQTARMSVLISEGGEVVLALEGLIDRAASSKSGLDPQLQKIAESYIPRFALERTQYATAISLVEERRRELVEKVQDKVCLIGDVQTSGTDFAPIPLQDKYPKVGVHANVFSSIVSGTFIQTDSQFLGSLLGLDAPLALEFLTWLLLAMLVLVFVPVMGIVRGGLFIGGLVVAYTALATWLLTTRNVWIPVTGPCLASALSYLAITLYRYRTEEHMKNFYRKSFATMVDPKIVDAVVDNPEILSKLGGANYEVTAFFSDIAGFTTISELLEPDQLAQMLTDYLTPMTDIIVHDFGGTRDKYIGDAIVAFWGAPLPSENHAIQACLASLKQHQVAKALKKKWLYDSVPWYLALRSKTLDIDFRIGLNTGVVKVGSFGSKGAVNYTMIGDAVNLAARLEGANKPYETDFMISENTYRMAHDAIEVRDLDILQVKGKLTGVNVFEVLCEKGQLTGSRAELIGIYTEGLKLYRAKRWNEAEGYFDQALALDPKDGPSKLYKKRVQDKEMLARLPDDWDGTYVMTTK